MNAFEGKIPHKQKVAVIGTGMAGLATAWLLQQDVRKQYEIQVFECGRKPSLDASSITVTDSITNQYERIDVPMRAFTEGYYHNLKSMYDYLGVRYRVQPFIFSFSQVRDQIGGVISKQEESQYFIHTSNNHQLPPIRPPFIPLISWVCEVMFALVCYTWFTLSCLFVPTAGSNDMMLDESFEEYLQRIRLPKRFVSQYLLPLMAAIATCPRDTLLRFPAEDIVRYKRSITAGRQFIVSNGVGQVQRLLLKDLPVRYSCQVTQVSKRSSRILVRWCDLARAQDEPMEAIFDKVVLAIPPNVIAKVFEPLQKKMDLIPSTSVLTVVHTDCSLIPNLEYIRQRRQGLCNSQNAMSQIIHLKTCHGTKGITEATHVQHSGVMVTSCPITKIADCSIINSSMFTRVLRTPQSRKIVNQIFGLTNETSDSEKSSAWRNGDDGVFLVGSWCWDGMVLLEGCIVSASRTARALGVTIPWIQ